MVNILKEYFSWYKENKNFYEDLKSHESILHTRLSPVYDVLYYIFDEYKENNMIDSDIDKIMQVGLEYIHQQFFTCKLYYEKFFDNDFHMFLKYDQVISYILFLEDLKYEFAEQNIDFNEDKFDDLVEYLELIISNKDKVPENINVYVDSKVSHIIELDHYNFHSIIDIFVEIGNTLGLDFDDEEDIVIGEEV